MKQQVMWVCALAAALAGCGSNVRLDAPPTVEDRVSQPLTSGSIGTKPELAGKPQTNVEVVNVPGAGQDPAAATKVGNIVYFEFDSAVIPSQYQNVVEAQARHLKANAKLRAMLEGHTDERGGREYNLALGQRRAEAVGKALTLLGVPGGQLEAVSFGKEKPVVVGADEGSWAKNRRVEIKSQ